MKEVKLGFEAPKSNRQYSGFRGISVHNMHYCKSHNFCYDEKEQNRLLHFGQACYYTDKRFQEAGFGNFYKECQVYFSKRKPLSFKAAMRRARKIKGLPKGTLISFEHSHYMPKTRKCKSHGLGYNFKTKKDNPFNPVYEVTEPAFFNDFTEDKKAQELTDLLRANGFLVQVWEKNIGFIYGEDEGEIAIAYGHGLRIGYSSGENTFRGYGAGCKSVLFDKWDEFNKWSQCMGAEKTLSSEEILKVLLYEAIQ